MHVTPTKPATLSPLAGEKGNPLSPLMVKELGNSSNNAAMRNYISTEGWSVQHLLDIGRKNFREVERVKASLPIEELRNKILDNEEKGIPLIVEGWHEHPDWDKDNMSMQYFLGQAAEGMCIYLLLATDVTQTQPRRY